MIHRLLADRRHSAARGFRCYSDVVHVHLRDEFRFVNDHDPMPLIGQIQQRYGSQIGINYVAREPGNIVIDFRIQLGATADAAPAAAPKKAGSCGGDGGSNCCG